MNAATTALDRLRAQPVLTGAVALFVLLVAVYPWSIGIRASWGASITGDEPFYLITTQSLLDEGDLDLRREFDRHTYASFFDHADDLWDQSAPRPDGMLLSPHNVGLPFLLIPGFALGALFDNSLLGTQWEMVIIAALTFALAYVLVARLTSAPLLAWLSTAAVSLSATSFIYSSEIYPEVPAALLLVVALLLATARQRSGVAAAIVMVFVLTAMVWLGVKYAPLAGVVGAYALWRSTPSARWIIVAGGLACTIAYAWFHLAVFGHLTPYSINLIYAGQATTDVIASHASYVDRLYRLWGLFVDQRFGIGRWAPALLVVPLGAPLLWRAGAHARLLLALIVVQILLATFVAITMMGWWFPGRTLVTVLPLMAVPIAYAALRLRPYVRYAIAALAAYSIAITLVLAIAGRAREIAVAVNPFDLHAALFRLPAAAFPNYTSWTVHTWVLHLVWLALVLSAIAFATVRPRVR